MTDARQRLSRYIRNYMKEHDKSSRQLASDLNVSVSTIERWRWGNCVPKYDRFREVAEYFGLDLTEAAIMATDTDEHEYALSYMLDCLHLILGISLKDMLKVIQVESSTYCNWKDGEARPSKSNVLRISSALSWSTELVEQMSYMVVPYTVNANLLRKAAGGFIVTRGRIK